MSNNALDAIGTDSGIITIIDNITLSDTIVINGNGNYIIREVSSIIDCGGDNTAFEITNVAFCTIQNLEINASAITSSDKPIIKINEINDFYFLLDI